MNRSVLTEPSTYFWLRSGTGLRSIQELANVLPSLSQDEFSHHVNAEKNDFANWILHIFGEGRLAEQLRRCTARDELQSMLYNAIVRDDLQRRKDERSQRKQETEEAVVADPESFAAYHQKDAEKKDALADRFDAVSRRFIENAHPETPEDVEKSFETLEGRYRELRQRIAEARKAGKDPFIADLTLRPAIPKLSYARLTGERRDFEAVRLLLDETERELADALAANGPDARKEVDALVAGNAKAAKDGANVGRGGGA